MTDLSIAQKLTEYKPVNKVRFITAASLFDGHDASINIMRRILMANGAEVVHLGHNRSVDDIVTAALQEDAQGIALSSYQGGHVEYFKYMIDLLRERGGAHIKVFGGGGGVIVPEEIAELHAYGVTRIFSPEDGQRMGLVGMILSMIQACDIDLSQYAPTTLSALAEGDIAARQRPLAQLITALENGRAAPALRKQIVEQAASLRTPTLGITGTGGAGKSSLTDELIRRLRLDQDDALNIALISIDPSRRKSGGALLGDRIRMNAIAPWQGQVRVFMRSLATREAGSEISQALPDVIAACKVAGFDLVIVETSGIGQGDAAIVPHVDVSMYVMTPEFGAASQLEKIDMLDFADFVAINKFDRKGSLDALRDVAKQYQRNRELWSSRTEEMPVFGTQASRFNDDGVTALYQGLRAALQEKGLAINAGKLSPVAVRYSSGKNAIVPPARSRYLAEIADTVRGYHKQTVKQVKLARERQQLHEAARMLREAAHGKTHDTAHELARDTTPLDLLASERDAVMSADSKQLIASWPQLQADYAGDEFVTRVRDKELRTQLVFTTLSGTRIRKVALPRFEDHGEILRWLRAENVPGAFPYTAGVFPFKREGEDPTRMFAGEGDPFRTNRRFKLVSTGMDAKRLSTAFDSVTLYGADPAVRPDIYGKVGNSGVSVATLDDMQALYDGFDLTSPSTSVSMTINGPAPTILAMFMNTAIEQNLAKFRAEQQREPDAQESAKIRAWVLQNVRGTVQADILKEDQGQNTCIFSTEFSLKVMGDIQQYFVQHQVRNFYSVSISGYHIAEAGANPISQLAFTLSNGFTFVEAYLARGMHIDDFAPNLSFFFSNGMDPEYTVLG
ncbi:MAG: methylmalonyl-CoA mutase family protein, partial [Pseudomonadota bacterium]|nr:methylmalonyl-CoA mutase family protein [Pseudomonadota bacterium]